MNSKSRPKQKDPEWPLGGPALWSASRILPRWKLWTFRGLAALLAPCALLILLELTLRAVGFGYPTGFLLAMQRDGHNYFVQNNQFGWRFFGRQMSRVPHAIFMRRERPADTVRIFVFGESAAFGDPQPSFGLARMLQALLELRYRRAKFEVINAAMTGINSHAILPIARDCADAAANIWVVYMGNNEVVGPFGAGTVFGMQAAPLPLIRANLALRATRTGQLIQSFANREHEERDWGGMRMFLNHQVSPDDARMTTVYRNFEHNLHDIFDIAGRQGAGVVVSTVASNLKECAPFASAHRAGLSAPDLKRWDELWHKGQQARAAGDNAAAAESWREAGRLDDDYAELRFALAAVSRDLGQTETAQNEYRAARDLDTLRFRCDSRLNAIIRRVAGERASRGVLLADAEQSFSRRSGDGLPGSDLFYDHVHLTFEGNYLLARLIAREAEKLLPTQIAAVGAADRPWPTLADCAQRLGWSDLSRREAALEMLRRLSDPPFTAQMDHATQLERLKRVVMSLIPAATPGALAATLRQCEAAASSHPEDDDLSLLLATLSDAVGETNEALAAAKRAVTLAPSNAEAWGRLGSALEKQRRFAEAGSAYRQVLTLDSQAFYALNNLGRVLAQSGRTNDAMAAYGQAVAIQPRFGPAWLSLGELLETSGRKSEAEECYSKALANRIRNPAELMRLATFCYERGWSLAAATNFAGVVDLDPTDLSAYLHAGQCFAAAGLSKYAERYFRDAVQLAPDSAPAHFLYGRALGERGDPVGAEEQFRVALRLMPELVEARLNLALSLMKQDRAKDAIAEYEAVLERWPTNQLALRNLERLRAAVTAGPSR